MRKLIILKITESMQKHPETNYICSDSYSWYLYRKSFLWCETSWYYILKLSEPKAYKIKNSGKVQVCESWVHVVVRLSYILVYSWLSSLARTKLLHFIFIPSNSSHFIPSNRSHFIPSKSSHFLWNNLIVRSGTHAWSVLSTSQNTV